MADAIHRSQRDANGALLRAYSIHTPDYPTSAWIINPDLSAVAGVPEYYWKVSGNSVVEMDNVEKNQVNAERLIAAKTARISYLNDRAGHLLELRYNGLRDLYLALYTDSAKLKPKRQKEIQAWVDWIVAITNNLNTKTTAVKTANTIEQVNSICLDENTLFESDPQIGVTGIMGVVDDGTIENFLNANAVVEDPITHISGPFYLMQILQQRKELYNDSENPIYDPAHSPILGATGMLQLVTNRVSNLEVIHGKIGWHEQQIAKALYDGPRSLLIYYGYPNSFNSDTNGWNNEAVAQDMAKYSIIVLGDGVQDPSHPDYANTEVIIPRVKALNPSTLIFGYVTADQNLTNFQTKSAQWDTLQVHGIFMDEAGYDFGRTRSDFNSKVDYVHGLSHSRLCFVNSWNPNHVLGVENDPSFPNSTYNQTLMESKLTSDDWILLESFPVNTLVYPTGYESAASWYTRGGRMTSLRAAYGVNFAGCGIIDNNNQTGQTRFNFGYASSIIWSLDAYGTSDTYYGASTAQVKYWARPNIAELGKIWNINVSVQQDKGDTGIYHRYFDHGRVSLGWTSAGETGAITLW